MQLDGREIYFETLVLGDLARVCAIDAASGIEVLATGPASAARHDLERLAMRKLERALIAAGLIAPRNPSENADGGGATSGGGRGRLV